MRSALSSPQAVPRMSPQQQRRAVTAATCDQQTERVARVLLCQRMERLLHRRLRRLLSRSHLTVRAQPFFFRVFFLLI
jgi:hypothetical protein